MAWLGDACKCRCGWACDPIDESDQERVCEKCGTVFVRKSYGWCQAPEENQNTGKKVLP